MKLKLTPELFILQDAVSQSENTTSSQEEEKKEEINQNDLEHKLKQINRTKRFIETPDFHLSNSDKFNEQSKKNSNELNSLQSNQAFSQFNQINKLNQKQVEPAKQPSIKDFIPYYSLEQNLIENNGRLSYDKRLIKRRPTRDIIQSDIRCVTLNKEKYGGFGLTIKGGLEFNKPLIISGINRSSAADKCRSLFLGDLIVELNGQSTYPLSLTHEQVMKSIKSGGHKLYLTVKHLTMYNRPIGRIWHRRLSFCLSNCENKTEDWSGSNSLINQDTNRDKLDSTATIKNDRTIFLNNQFSTNKSSSQESYMQTSSSVNQDHQLTDSEQYSNCETTTLSNLTALDKDDLHTPSPLNDEGVYTGLSNDALSSSECTSDASGFSSDYIQSSSKQNAHCKNFHLTNSNLHQQTICASSCCKNKKNNNCCAKCIVNKNHQTCYSSLEQQTDLRQEKTMHLISKEHEFKLPAVDQNNKENMISYSFRSVDSCNSAKRGTNSEHYLTNGDQKTSTCSLSSTDNLVDIVSVSLINCYFTKYILNTDSLRRNSMQVQWYQTVTNDANQMKSIDVSGAVINFNDTALTQQFQQQINHYLSKLNESYMFSFNRGLSPQNRILFMGWVSLALPKTNSLQLTSSQLASIDYKWQPKYMIIKGGELILYNRVPDYLIDKIKALPYANDTLMEFNELSDLLVNKNGTLACSITLNNSINKSKSNAQHNRKSTRSSLTRHLSIRGRDSTINPSDRFNEQRILTETNANQNKTTNNRLISTLTRNLSLKTSKENRYKQMNSKLRSANLHCTLPRNQFIDHQLTSSQDKNLKRTGAESNLFKQTDFQSINQQSDKKQQTIQPKQECTDEPIIFKAYQSVLRQLKPDEQLDKRENCLLALTTQSGATNNSFVNRSSNSLSTFGKQSINRSTDELENSSPNIWSNTSSSSSSRKNSLDDRALSNASRIAYLTVEHADNISQILKSWNVATMHSVQQLSKKSFPVISEGRYGHLTLDWNTGFTLYDESNLKWNFKFSQLKNSSDDGCKTLWLSFQSIKHQPVRPVMQRANALNLASFSNQSDNNSSLNSSMDSVDQYSQRGRALTPNSFDSHLNGSTMNSTLSSSNQLNNNDYSSMNSNYLQTNRTEFRIKKSIETKELTCSNLQHLIYCMHSFLSAKVTSVASIPNQQQASLNGILV